MKMTTTKTFVIEMLRIIWYGYFIFLDLNGGGKLEGKNATLILIAVYLSDHIYIYRTLKK